jgi:hypothetical protein
VRCGRIDEFAVALSARMVSGPVLLAHFGGKHLNIELHVPGLANHIIQSLKNAIFSWG